MLGPVSWLILAPMLGAILCILTPAANEQRIKWIATVASGIPVLIALFLVLSYDKTDGSYQFIDKIKWLPALGINYQVGIDGISAVLVLLHSLCGFTGILVSHRIQKRVKEYFIFYLLLIGGVFGVFTSLDIFFFYVFYEMAVIPMFPLIGIWGSGEKVYATMKLTLYLTAGAVLALIGLITIYGVSGAQSFDLIFLEQFLAQNPIPGNIQVWIFPFVFLGFACIVPMWPLHSWSPLGHAAAPSAVSMLHAGVLMKLGGYAILRIAIQLLPEGAYFWMPYVAGIACMNIIYGGFVAMYQKDMKFRVGYSSSSHMGYVLLGLACLNEIGLHGAVFLMFAHGIMTALAFAAIGHIYDQTHTRVIKEWGGLAKQIPFVSTLFIMAALASSGLPGFANFVSELLVFFAAWDVYRISAIAAIFGIVTTAFYMLRAVRDAFFGPLNPKWADLKDATTFEKIPYLILLGALLIGGCWPSFFLDLISASSGNILAHLQPLQAVAQL